MRESAIIIVTVILGSFAAAVIVLTLFTIFRTLTLLWWNHVQEPMEDWIEKKEKQRRWGKE